MSNTYTYYYFLIIIDITLLFASPKSTLYYTCCGRFKVSGSGLKEIFQFRSAFHHVHLPVRYTVCTELLSTFPSLQILWYFSAWHYST